MTAPANASDDNGDGGPGTGAVTPSPHGAPLADLALSRTTIERAGHERAGAVDRLLTDPSTRVLEVRGDRLAVDAGGDGDLALRLRGPVESDRNAIGLHLGRGPDGTAYLGVIVTEPAPEDDRGEHPDSGDLGGWLTLRQAGEALSARDAGLFTTALALANWHATHTHCPRCGAATEPVQAGWVRRCVSDGSEHYPRTNPAVIMSVIDPDDRLLLGRGAHWPEGRFSVLAGFVEPGESFEAAVAREVLEEVGVVIDGATYLGNQPWPFPASLMVGFVATTSQTQLTPDPAEIAEARWVTRTEYRDLLASGAIKTPSGISIAKRIIEHWLGQTVESVAGAEVVDR
ncbi:MAG: diphosphatase [Humibacillus sp.]|nr:diphosphatase [Humibacillus sp.]